MFTYEEATVFAFPVWNMGLLFSDFMFLSQEPEFKQLIMERLSLGHLELVK